MKQLIVSVLLITLASQVAVAAAGTASSLMRA